ncbi:MAG: GNAT family N-acetyltransferase [Thiomicrospira sp.]|jgi:RimJ/RimL family protein N-acetyltransferase
MANRTEQNRTEQNRTEQNSVVLRLANFDDVNILYEWRNDEATRLASHNSEPVAYENHVSWLKNTLQNPDRILYIAEFWGKPIGTLRLDKDGDFYEVSWTIAPTERGKGLGTKMVSKIIGETNFKLRAEVKENNLGSKKIAEFNGFELTDIKSGVLHYMLNR